MASSLGRIGRRLALTRSPTLARSSQLSSLLLRQPSSVQLLQPSSRLASVPRSYATATPATAEPEQEWPERVLPEMQESDIKLAKRQRNIGVCVFTLSPFCSLSLLPLRSIVRRGDGPWGCKDESVIGES